MVILSLPPPPLIGCHALLGPDGALGCCSNVPEFWNPPVQPDLKITPGLTSVTVSTWCLLYRFGGV